MKAKERRKVWLSIGATVGLLAMVWLAGTALAQQPEGGVTPQGGCVSRGHGGGQDQLPGSVDRS
jgi:hypothetical protein